MISNSDKKINEVNNGSSGLRLQTTGKYLPKEDLIHEPTVLMYVYELHNIILCAIVNFPYESISW